MRKNQIQYESWLLELEAELRKQGQTYVPSAFYEVIGWYFKNGHSPKVTSEQMCEHLKVVESLIG